MSACFSSNIFFWKTFFPKCLAKNARLFSQSAIRLNNSHGHVMPKKKLVIVGSGWAGTRVLREINGDAYDTTVMCVF